MSVEKNLISLVVPARNEAASLPLLFAEFDAVAAKLTHKMEVIVIDDGSNDESWKVIAEKSKLDSRYRGVRFRRNFGKTAAYAAAFAQVRGEIVVTLDADLQDDPQEIPRFLEALKEYDFVSGWKKVRHDPWHKVASSRGFNWLVSRVTGVKLHDHNCGYKAFRSEILSGLRLHGDLHRFLPVLAATRGFRTGEIVIQHRPRRFGRSHYGFRRVFKGLLDLSTVRFLTTYSSRPQHALGTAGFAAFFLGFIGLFLLLVCTIAGWMGALWQILLAIFSIGALLGGGMLFLAGILGDLIVSRTAEPALQYSIAETSPPSEPRHS